MEFFFVQYSVNENTQRPPVGSSVMLSGGEPNSKCALRLGEVGKVIEDDCSFVPFAVQGPRGDTDWYGEREVLLAGERQMSKERQILGDQIFARIAESNPDTAAKVTGMLLDALDDTELTLLMADPSMLALRVQEAHNILHYYSLPAGARQQQSAAPAGNNIQAAGNTNLPPEVSPLIPCSPPPLPTCGDANAAMDDVSMLSPFSFDTPSILNGDSMFNSSIHNEIPADFPCVK